MEDRKCCPEFVENILRQCRTNASRTAIIDQNGRRSDYGTFYDTAKRTAGYIKSGGIVPGSFIVICLPDSMEYLAVGIGCWLAGCAIVPLNIFYPKERVQYITGHCESPLVIDEAVFGDILKSDPIEICETGPDIAALFYTSGSTGTPKGVIHTFDTLGHIAFFSEFCAATPDDVFATGAPLSFVAGLMILPFLGKGACVRLVERGTMTDARKLRACFETDGITVSFLSPSVLRQMDFSNNGKLRLMLTGSERVCNLVPGQNYRLINIYGMTETACGVCWFEVTRPYSNTPIGKPTADCQFRIMEDGELCLRGPLTPGYYKDAERSAALWRGGWLHTGDLARELPDGNIEYVNRKDWMVKINGQRVETGEIMEVLRQVPGVSNATAKGFTAPDGHQYIVAYYVADEGVGENQVRDFLSRKLAPYMIPAYFVRMAALPLNVNGKVDVHSLQSPLEVSLGDRKNITAPITEDEKALCKAFESSLGISPIGMDDDFFCLGGDSIRVMQLQVACPQLNLSSTLIYRERTVRGICAALEKESAAEAESGDVCPLSRTQTGIFVECMARRGEVAYNNPFLLKVTDHIDAERLAQACACALKAHPNLFASIRMDQGDAPVQVKNSPDDFSIAVENLSDSEFDLVRATLVQPFDILADRLFRIRVFKTPSALWLFTDFHHIIFDGTSNSIILEDIERAYRGESVEAESFTGFDLACLENRLRSSGGFLEECRQWNLDTFSQPDRTSLPDPDRFADAVAFAKFEIETGISADAFSKAAHTLGVTENVLSTGAFGHMLGACSHSSEAAFTTIYNGRKSLRTARTVSMMVKTLPVYCKWDKTTLAGDYFSAVKDQLSGAMAHDLFSFAEICADTSYDSRVLFSYQDTLLERNTLCGLPCEMTSLLENATGEPLAVQLYKSGGSLKIRTEYRSNMYSEPYIRKFISCFTNILSGLILADRSTPLSGIGLVGEREKEALAAIGRGRTLDYDRSLTFVGMFRKMVAAHPDSIAVVDQNGSMTYSELDSASDALASQLVAGGVAPEDFVAIMLPRLNLYPVSYVACFKSGAAYVPMDYEYPVDRLQYMLEDSGAKVLITTHDIFERKTAEGLSNVPAVLFADDSPEKVQTLAGIDRSRPDSLAYMIYTSGTTGKPKGVMIEHHSLTNLVHWYAQLCGTTYGSRVAEHASFSFDGSVTELMTPLCFGGQLHILAASLRKDLAAMYRYFCENRIDSTLLTTQLGMTMLRMYDLKLKSLLLGGEKLSGRFKTSVKLINGYGPTEFTVCSSYYVVDPDNTPDNIPIGKAVPNTISAIVDSCGRLLPQGVAGELVLIGEQLSRGYWHRPDITSERFTPCPFLPGLKMYHTGDLAKWSDEGELLFLGRIDTQVKLRGFRIELGEIESNISRFAGIKAAVAAVREIGGVQHLCAYYVADSEIDKDELRRHLASSLTDYMVPTAYVQMDAFPMTPNGKVNLRALPVPEVRAEEIVSPANETETALFELVSEYLGNRDFGVTTNLISMGMTSLGAITLSLSIERKAGLNIPSPKILECPTIRGWVEYLKGEKDTASEGVQAYEHRDLYPMTDNQTGIYIDWEQHKDSTQYNVPMLMHFKGVKPDTVVEAVKSFIGAHPYLSTFLKSIDGQVMQVRNASPAVEVPVRNLDKEPDKSFFQSLLKPFDLFEGPLFRFSVFTSGDSTWLLSDFHHIVFDGGSEAIFAKEIIQACNGEGTASPEEFSAFDYSLYYDDWKRSEQFDKAQQYFVSLLEGTVAGNIPSTSSPEGSGSATITVRVERAPLRQLCRKAGVTENALFLSSVTEVLHRISREQNIAILTVSNGRSLRALESSCGMFVQTLPIVSHVARRKVGESLSMMQDQIVETLARDKFPYTKIVEKTGLKAGILLAYQGDVLDSSLEVDGKEVELTGLQLDTAKLPLSVNVTPGKESTAMAFEYDKAVYSAEDVALYANAVRNFIENLTQAGTDALVEDISCVSDKEGKELVALGSGPSLEVAAGTVVTLFKRRVEEHPDDPAVSDMAGTLTYLQLDKASDLLAAELLRAGLKKEDFVSLMMPRCKEYAIAYMAVFKSGGAYVPMDSEYPIDRLQYMVDDSRSRFMITTRGICAGKAAEGEIRVDNMIFLDELDFQQAPSAPAVDNSDPDALAYMIYTSGTTGKPKGVMIEHHALMNMMAWNSALSGCVRGTPVAEHPSFSFDASVIDLTTTLAFGGHLHILDEETRKDPEKMYKYITANAIEVMCASTQIGMMLLSSYKLPVRYMMLGGEKLTGKYDKSVTVVNGYGPTEFTVCSSYHILDNDRDNDNIPIGRAVANTLSAIVDTCGRLVPRGVPGELVLVGPQIARGYWNKDDITAKRFTPCPFIPGSRMYHTGDLARWSKDGELLFMGRIDTQVKLRGFRIELGEIESQMAAFPDVTAAVALVKEIGGVQHLCAYFTASSKVDTAALKAHLSSCLTGYMVPDSLMQMDAFPLTPNGKVDGRKLPLPDLASGAAESFEAPEGETENAVAKAFQTVLGMDAPISRNASFFRMGGTSLLVMKVIVMLSEQGYELTYSDVFKYQSPCALAAFIEGCRTAAAAQAPAQAGGGETGTVQPSAKGMDFTEGEDGFDYSAINKMLEGNSIPHIKLGELDVNPIGDVLLLGSTGYLGIHVLYNLLENTDSKVYCVIRAKKGVTCAGRLKSYLMYYFDKTYADLMDKRLFVIEGDMTDDAILDKLRGVKVDTVINCAANVKHFAAGDEIEKINIAGTEKLIGYCLETDSRLIHTSTHSISGQTENGKPHTMLESELYFGQKLMTKYQTSKFAAERAVLEACAKDGLRAKIMRLGNLMPRFSDGEFQINIENNGFMARMRAYYLIGCIPSEHLHSALEFAPIDETADAVLTLARTPDEFTVFHPFNNHTIYVDDVVSVMRKCGLEIKVTDFASFNARLEECLKDDHLNPLITALLAYGSHSNYTVNQPSLDFTVNVLNAMDWRWPITGVRYLGDAFEKMIALEYFDK